MADDFVLILNETLEDAVDLFPKTNPNALSTYRIGLLEYALQQSPDNFDIQMSLVRLFDSCGLPVSFKTTHDGLGLKGVQMESMGFI